MSGSVIDTFLTFPQRRHVISSRYKFVTTSAGDIPYIDTGGNKRVVLMTPDAPCVIEHHHELIKILSSEFRVICFEMPGSGFSFPKAKYHFTVKETASAILEFVDALKIESAIFNFTCVNGFHAMNFSSRFPSRVSHLVLGQTPSIADMKNWTNYNIPKLLRIPFIGQLVGHANNKILSNKWFSLSLPRRSEHVKEFQKLSLSSLNSGGCFCLASIVQGALNSPDKDMMGTQHPTLMIYGTKDFSHRHSNFTDISGSIPHVRTIEFENCGHFPHIEQPHLFADKLCQFVK